jgi:hypothetical protein
VPIVPAAAVGPAAAGETVGPAATGEPVDPTVTADLGGAVGSPTLAGWSACRTSGGGIGVGCTCGDEAQPQRAATSQSLVMLTINAPGRGSNPSSASAPTGCNRWSAHRPATHL